MSYDCYCDYDQPQVYRASIVRARKTYECEECGGPIKPGEQHESAFGVLDGWTYAPRTCARCVDMRTWVKNNVPCLCWSHGGADTDMAEAIEEATMRAPDETRGLWFGFLRRKVLRDRHNKLAEAA